MSDRAVGVCCMIASVCLGLFWMGSTLGWEIILPVLGVVLMSVALCGLFVFGVIMTWPNQK